MNAEEYEGQLNELIAMAVNLYGVIGKLFGLLPIPVSLPVLWEEIEDEDTETPIIIGALLRARSMLRDLPLDPRFAAALNMAVVEWLGAFDMCALASADHATREVDAQAYRLEVIRLATGRIVTLTELARDHLDQNL